jgi:arabinose-5-phosphate isomerase
MAKKQAEILREIRRVIALEARALALVGAAVDGRYAEAVALLAACKGKVILTGVGKSGLIAQKIAATLSSTGTPSIYLDPAEAQHGSLGLVQKADLVVALGKSGESDELNNLLPRIRAVGARVIAVTANDKSTLAKAAAVVLITPIEEEACPHNLAPTCSTTAALAVGDALAVCLMKLRGFGADQFAKNHPGGRLGRRLTLTVADIMRSGEDNPVIRPEKSVSEMLDVMTAKRAGAVCVVDARGKFLGLVTDYDIRRMLGDQKNILSSSIRRIMNPKPTTVRPDSLAEKAREIMENRKNPFNVLPVVDKAGRSVGLVQIHDLRARGL